MSPIAASVPAAPVQWWREMRWPARTSSPTQGTTVDLQFANNQAVGYDMGQVGGATPIPQMRQLSLTGADTVRDARTVGGVWCLELRSTGATGAQNGQLWRPTFWTPQTLNSAAAPFEDDPAHAIGWLQALLFTDVVNPCPTADVLGVSLIPDDGSIATVATLPSTVGGCGIYQRTGGQDYRFRAWAAGGALLNSVDLAAGAGWHTADFIIRQARRSDVLTPWLTLRWDGVEVFTQVPFDGVLLPTPQSVFAAAFTWSFLFHGIGLTAVPWQLSHAFTWRQGGFHPDGYPVT